MDQFRFATILLALGATMSLANASAAHMSPYMAHGGRGPSSGGSSYSGSMRMMARPMPMGGSKGNYGAGGCCGGMGHMNPGAGHMTYGGTPRLGMHPMGMHFYGMGGGSLKTYGRMYGGHSYGMSGGHAYGMGGGHEMHAPLGSHVMGMHYYGMGGGGSLAEKYGHLEHGFGEPVNRPVSWGASPYPAPQPKTWGKPVTHNPYGPGPAVPPKSGRRDYGHEHMTRASYGFKYSDAFKYSYGFKASYKSGGGAYHHGAVHPPKLYAVQ